MNKMFAIGFYDKDGIFLGFYSEEVTNGAGAYGKIKSTKPFFQPTIYPFSKKGHLELVDTFLSIEKFLNDDSISEEMLTGLTLKIKEAKVMVFQNLDIFSGDETFESIKADLTYE